MVAACALVYAPAILLIGARAGYALAAVVLAPLAAATAGALTVLLGRMIALVERPKPAAAPAAPSTAEQARLLRLAGLGRLASGVAHEINNPLSYVYANVIEALEELGQGTLSPQRAAQVRELLSGAREGAERIRDVCRDLTALGNADEEEAGGVVDVRRALEMAAGVAEIELASRARLVKEYGATPWVAGVESQLVRLFLNLLLDAIRAFREGEPGQNQIRIATRPGAPGRVLVELTSTGARITLEPLAGAGRGPVCQRIARELGGEITVEALAGRGTSILVDLPAAEGPYRRSTASMRVVVGLEPPTGSRSSR